MILTERLLVNDVEQPISGYSVKTPTGGLGESLSVALSNPNPNLILPGDVIKFELGAGKETAPGVIDYSWVSVIDTGKADGRTFTVKWIPDDSGGFPGDVFEVSALSPLADKWGLAPRVPLIMYNPDLILAPETLIPESKELIRRYGAAIGGVTYLTPRLEAVSGLSLYHALDRAYTSKNPLPELGVNPGFDRVVTNIKDFLIGERLDITLESGFHGAVASLYSIYNPVVFAADNVLYIIDPEGGLPPGFTPRQLELDCVIEVTENQAATELANAVILSYKENPPGGVINAGELPSIRIINEQPYESGAGRNYTRTEVSREITEYFDILSGELRRTQENWEETKTYAYRDVILVTPESGGGFTRERIDGDVRLIQTERISNRYVGNTKSSHSRSITGLYSNPALGGAEDIGLLETEEASYKWAADMSHPGEYDLIRSITTNSGLLLKETKEDGLIIYTPILEAEKGGIIEADDTQSLTFLPMETCIEELRSTGQNQSNVKTRIIDHLCGACPANKVQSRPGSRSTYMPPFSLKGYNGYKAGTIREIIEDEESIALYGLRKPITLDVGRLGAIEGRILARRKLLSAVSPPKNLTVTLPGIDFAIRRGSLLILPLRSGYTSPMITTGYTRSGRGLGTANARRDMVLEMREVIALTPPEEEGGGGDQ